MEKKIPFNNQNAPQTGLIFFPTAKDCSKLFATIYSLLTELEKHTFG